MALNFKSRLKHKAVIDITSLIDLVFLLVAFFMITSSLGSESSITVNLPRAVKAGEYKTNNLIVTINKDNKIYINDRPVGKKNVLNEFKTWRKKKEKLSVVIRGDKKANYEAIVFIMDVLNQAGISRFTISAIK